MVADFIFVEYGWLHSSNGKESACVLFRAGKGHDGYFLNRDILVHAAKAMDILERWYSHEDHVFIFNMQPHTSNELMMHFLLEKY
jgi:hypothetical protein